jgi:hypothetical protein
MVTVPGIGALELRMVTVPGIGALELRMVTLPAIAALELRMVTVPAIGALELRTVTLAALVVAGRPASSERRPWRLSWRRERPLLAAGGRCGARGDGNAST